MKPYFILLLAMCLSLMGLAQNSVETAKRVSYRKMRKRKATEQIVGLHDGVLLVRLKTKQPTIEALKERGKAERAAKVEAEQKQLNLGIVAAFKDSFDFCPVYFFYSNYTQQVKSGDLGSVEFLNEELQSDNRIKLDDPYYLTAEIGSVVEDTTSFFDRHYYEPTTNGPQKKDAYYGGNNFGFEALVMKSDQLIQLSRPFPYYVRMLRKPLPILVSELNADLHHFYERKDKWKK
ncbi:MAG: hypothetical protein AB8H47_25630 [Bacteroidia bacterium]